jgi:hypothetical protein
MLPLPDGYKVGVTTRSRAKAQHTMLGDEWDITIYYRGYDAFEMVKRFDTHVHTHQFAARLPGGSWQKFKTITEMTRVMCIKHRIGIRHDDHRD